MLFDNTISFNSDDVIQYISVTAVDDKEIEGIESMCLELTTPSNQLAHLYPTTKTNVFIMDDEGMLATCTLYMHVHVLWHLLIKLGCYFHLICLLFGFF